MAHQHKIGHSVPRKCAKSAEFNYWLLSFAS